MLKEVLACISKLKDPKFIIDGTFGGGGHSKAIAGKIKLIVNYLNCTESFPMAKLVGVDRDPSVQANRYRPPFDTLINDGKLQLLTGRFSTLKKELQATLFEDQKVTGADVVLLDLGYSNNQVQLHSINYIY